MLQATAVEFHNKFKDDDDDEFMATVGGRIAGKNVTVAGN